VALEGIITEGEELKVAVVVVVVEMSAARGTRGDGVTPGAFAMYNHRV
jgi:hypothetical protein